MVLSLRNILSLITMSQVIYRDSFTDSAGDERLYTYTSTIETSTLSHDPVQSV
jgi:hypothetical protein